MTLDLPFEFSWAPRRRGGPEGTVIEAPIIQLHSVLERTEGVSRYRQQVPLDPEFVARELGRRQLLSIAETLFRFRQEFGRYPTTEEGLEDRAVATIYSPLE